ncbi:uncharacterized protein E0L32_011897 [Thyridium curvatum]|uniref:Uncharacterized protein n=1 Tax=Thyridium curvatum TaxID=1093900 RepID=A0A507BLG2_9PEZI|nr:uncharacterized protein E0L32_011897 [Thyridium curvatum]TPX18031.1 hypothetical protein E0L32_011897 [Thyridium curvatum]
MSGETPAERPAKRTNSPPASDPGPLPVSPPLPDPASGPRAKDAAADTPEAPDYLPGETRIHTYLAALSQRVVSKFMVPTSDELANFRWNEALFSGMTEPLTHSVLLSHRKDISNLTPGFKWLDWEDLSVKSRAYISSWAPDAKIYFNSPRPAPFDPFADPVQKPAGNHDELADDDFPSSVHSIHHAWVSHILWDHIFSPEASLNKWHGPHWGAYGKLRREIEAHLETEDDCFVRSFHFWRYSTVHMLYMIHGMHSDSARLEAILREELQEVKGETEHAAHMFEKNIAKLARGAIVLDLTAEAHQRKVVFDMDHPDKHAQFGFRFDADPNSMSLFQSLQLNVTPEDLVDRQVHFVTDMGVRIYGEEVIGQLLAFNRSSNYEYFTHNYTKLSAHRPIKVSVDMDGLSRYKLGPRDEEQRGDPDECAQGGADAGTEHERVAEDQAVEARTPEDQAVEARTPEGQTPEARSEETEE